VSAKKKNPSFGEAVQEVEDILGRLEGDEVDVDELTVEVKRAVELVGLCRDKLRRTELEVKEFVAQLDQDEEPTDNNQGDGALPF
jgi:exodeoxyribonuclease VII small subunit